MGSFAFTCAISRLPIEAGDRVRYILLQSSPFSDSGNYARGELSWYIRALPVRASYNDYGTIEDIEPDDVAICQNWLDGLKIDMIEKGWGDNTCHDVPVRHEMTFDELREALWERRVEVRPELRADEERRAFNERIRSLMKPKPIARGIPTIRRIEAAIRRSGNFTYTVNTDNTVHGPGGKYTYVPPKDEKNYSAEYDPRAGFGCAERVDGADEAWCIDATGIGNESHKLIVDQLRRGEIRVRLGGYGRGPEESMRMSHLAAKLRRKYSVMLSPGEYGHAQLIIHPKPGTKDGDHCFDFHTRTDSGKPRSCHIAVAMVREDVWQALCGMTSEFWDKKYATVNGTLDVYRRLARDAWDAYQKDYAPKALDGDDERAVLLRSIRYWKWWGHDTHNPIGWFTGDNPSISGFGMDTSWKIFADGERSEKDVEVFLEALAQTALVNSILRIIRHEWRPVGSVGPQFGEWKEHAVYANAIAGIAAEQAKTKANEGE